MNVIVWIEGREAIPVRAIPLLTNWESIPPAALAKVLAGNDDIFGFEGLKAYQHEDGVVKAVTAAWWRSFSVKKLKALSERIELTYEHKDIKKNQWQLESMGLLPAGIFVWKNEYTTLHESNWDSRLRESLHSAWFLNKCEEPRQDVDETEDTSPIQIVAMSRVRADYETWRTLDFSPTIAPGTYENIVLEGFGQQIVSKRPETPAVIKEPVVSHEPKATSSEIAPILQTKSITSKQVALLFDSLPYSAENWPKRLSGTKWLKPANIALGEVGGITGLWCPLILARLVHGRIKGREKQKTLEALNTRFKRNTALHPWRDAWNEHYALFTDTIDD